MSNFIPLPVGTVLQNRYQLTTGNDELETQAAGQQANQPINDHILGVGGMGAVYLALHTGLKRYVAVKQTLLADDVHSLRAFESEAGLLANLNHPALPHVNDFFEENGSYFLVMELIKGDNLFEMIQNMGGNLPFEKVLDIGLQLLDVLDYLHTQNIIHRDIKPSNLKLTSSGQLKLLDFGLAKGSAGLMSKHESSILKGSTPAYASPEQDAENTTDARSDLYSTAATLYHLAGGKIPPHCRIRFQHVASKKPDPLRLVSDKNVEIPLWFAEILKKALSLWADERPASAAKMKETIQQQKRKARLEKQRLNEAEKYFDKGEKSRDQEDFAGAIESYTKAIELNPNYNTYYNRGGVHYDIEGYEQAIADYSKAIKLKPDLSLAFWNRGLAYSESGDIENAIADYTKYLEFEPNDNEAYNQRGETYFKDEEYDLAIDDYTKAINLDKNDVFAYVYRGKSYLENSDCDKAISDFTKAIELKPKFAYAFFNRGNANRDIGEYKEAISDFTKAIELIPTYAEAYLDRALTYKDLASLETHDFDHAISDFTKTIELAPNYYLAYYYRGGAYRNEGKKDKAILDFTKAIELNPNCLNAYYARVEIYSDTFENEKAIADYSKIIEIGLLSSSAYYGRGIAYSNIGEYEEAISDFTKSVELEFDDVLVFDYRGNAYFEIGNYDLAIADYTKAIELDSDQNFSRNRFLAIAYEKSGGLARAQADRQIADELDDEK